MRAFLPYKLTFAGAAFTMCLLACLEQAPGRAQLQGGELMQTFDVVSIKPSRSETLSYQRAAPGILVARGMSAKDLVRSAFTLRSFQIENGPGWMNSELYDISAKDTSGTTPQASDAGQINGMVYGSTRTALRSGSFWRTDSTFVTTEHKKNVQCSRSK